MVQTTTLEQRKIRRVIKKENQLQYIEVPFELSESIVNIRVKYAVVNETNEECVVDLGIRDPYRVRGWSGGARKEIEIGLKSSTPGYLSGNLAKGNWAVILGAYKIPENGSEVEVEIQIEKSTNNEETWLKGDLHMHSVHSDGSFTLEEITTIASEKQLDFIALTDHNTVSQNFDLPQHEDLTIIPGIELTTYKGHCNFFGINDPIKDFRAVNQEEIHGKVEEARSSGAKIAINHPHDPGCPWEWSWDVNCDFVEVWNGPWRPGNQRTLNWWQEQLVHGKEIIVIGGSDTHRPDPYVQHGMPTTWVKTTNKSQDGIFAGMEKGHVFLSYSPEGPTLELTCGGKQMGDTVTDTSQPVVVEVNRLQEGDFIKIISDKGIEQTYIVPKSEVTFREQLKIGNQKFYRVEVWKYLQEVDQTLMAAMCNPLYINNEGL
ncbi:CehA/McbA family metallohydrolase [Oceanobacillus sp. CF4.6]|uniref:CehA/McbA family metallohydrolase n=1 Tax=Oceanobacillus sp. CF4.6 TaxID=3373080 RepID=UPI003EE427E0